MKLHVFVIGVVTLLIQYNDNKIFLSFSVTALLFSLSSVQNQQAELVDESSVKKMILTFEKRSYKNQELRIKFPDNPEK